MKEQTEIDMLETREILTIMLLSRAIGGRPFGDCSGRHCFLVVVEGLAIEQDCCRENRAGVAPGSSRVDIRAGRPREAVKHQKIGPNG